MSRTSCPSLVRRLAVDGADDPRITGLVDAMARASHHPGLQGLIAERTGDGAWLRVRPPLVPIDNGAMGRAAATIQASSAAEAV